jgi:hypothetical protein
MKKKLTSTSSVIGKGRRKAGGDSTFCGVESVLLTRHQTVFLLRAASYMKKPRR